MMGLGVLMLGGGIGWGNWEGEHSCWGVVLEI